MCSPSASFNKGEQAAVLNSRLQTTDCTLLKKLNITSSALQTSCSFLLPLMKQLCSRSVKRLGQTRPDSSLTSWPDSSDICSFSITTWKLQKFLSFDLVQVAWWGWNKHSTVNIRSKKRPKSSSALIGAILTGFSGVRRWRSTGIFCSAYFFIFHPCSSQRSCTVVLWE